MQFLNTLSGISEGEGIEGKNHSILNSAVDGGEC
jgi:hypothetical protein